MSLPSVIKGMQDWSWFPTGGWNESEILLIQHLITTIYVHFLFSNFIIFINQFSFHKIHVHLQNLQSLESNMFKTTWVSLRCTWTSGPIRKNSITKFVRKFPPVNCTPMRNSACRLPWERNTTGNHWSGNVRR